MLFLYLLLCLLWCFAFWSEWEWEMRMFSLERRIIITDLDLVTDLLFHLLKFEVFWLIRSFLMFSYFDTFMLWLLDAFLLWCFSILISFICALICVSSMLVYFLELLLTQLHADLCVSFSDYSNLMTETVVYRKLLSETFVELSKTFKA
jgi:hypothetical protein